jgi:hypothetical protein
VDYRCNFSNPVVARRIWRKNVSKLSQDRQLGPCAHRHCGHPDRFKTIGSHLITNPQGLEQLRGTNQAIISGDKNSFCHRLAFKPDYGRRAANKVSKNSITNTPEPMQFQFIAKNQKFA